MKKIATNWLRGSAALQTLALLGAGTLTLSPAHAQAPQAADAGSADTIVVTGSRIARPELESASPIAVIGAEALQQNAANNVQDVLNELPQVGIGTSRTNSNFLTSGNGVAAVDLRNLGEDRTLVLVNGRRFVAGIAGSSTVDINNISPDLIERVEVVTGGASAVYGSDAIAGVVNFILKDKFEGIQARAQYGVTSRGDNPRYLASILAGTSFGPDGRGNIIANFSYDKDAGLLSRKRRRSAQDCFLDVCGPDSYSSYAPQGQFRFYSPTGAGGQVFSYDQNDALVTGLPSYQAGQYGYNRNAVRRISVPVERYLANLNLNYEVTDGIKAFAELTYAKVKSSSQLEPSAVSETDFFTVGAGGIPITNAFIPASVQAIIAGRNSDADPANDVAYLGFRRRLSDLFDRSNTNNRDTYRIAAGLSGDLTDRFSFNASYVYGRLKDNTLSQDVSAVRFIQALDSVVSPTGAVVCRDPSNGCVPLNLFGRNSIDPAASAFLQVPKYERIKNEEHVVTGSISGTLPGLSAGAIGVAVGAEYRHESSSADRDPFTETGGNTGNAIPDTKGKFDVWEVFGELNVPLLSETSFAHYLGLTGAVRYSDYSTVGSVFSWNAGAEWEPVRGLKLRGLYAVANRAPNVSELFSGASETFPGSQIGDPCEGVTATSSGALDAACRAIPGVAATIAADGTLAYSLADRQGINGFDPGNPNLNEEKARTLTFGAVLTPAAVPGFSLAVDYFRIKVKDAITTLPRDTSIEQCLATGEAQYCSNVIRDPANGRILTASAPLLNGASFKTSGIDVNLRYSRPLGLAADDRIDLSLLYTYLISLEQRPLPGEAVQENRGQLDGDGRLGAGFKHKASGRVTYLAGPLTLSWQVNYLSSIQDSIGEDFGTPELNDRNRVGDAFYHDVQARVAVGPDKRFEIYAGIDNLFDRQPPALTSGFYSSITGAETAADTYDPFGRRLYVGAQVRF